MTGIWPDVAHFFHKEKKTGRLNTSSEYHYKDSVLQHTPLLVRQMHEWMNLKNNFTRFIYQTQQCL